MSDELQKVKDRVKDISESSMDPEESHVDEDKLHRDVLRMIAGGAENPAELAAAALETLKLEFPRWYA